VTRALAFGCSAFTTMFRCLIFVFVAVLIAAVPLTAQTNVTGEWEASFVTPLGPQELKIYLTQEGPRVSGHTTSEYGESQVRGTINGQDIQLSFSSTDGGKAIEIRVTAKVDGESMKGTAKLGDAGEGSFSAERTGS
jgi:hypothetical protein